MSTDVIAAVTAASRIIVLQADNPDADSLGSALALEHILGDLGKAVNLYCGVDVPSYLRYLDGWDRVSPELSTEFDLSIIVDASTYSIFGQLEKSGDFGRLKRKPCVVLDHHAVVERPIDFAAASIIVPEAASTGQVIHDLAQEAGWSVTKGAAECLMTSVLGDTQGLTNDLTSAATYRLMADLTELGADRPRLEELRREFGKMPATIYAYKGRLLQRTEFSADGRIAHITIPQDEINAFSPLYNPGPLVQFDMLQVQGVELAIVFKAYDDGHVTGALRANHGAPIAGRLAEAMGGGGHAYASGFRVERTTIDTSKTRCLKLAEELLDA